MKNYIPTIEELQGIAQSELSVVFRKASEVAADENCTPTERVAAQKTMEIVRHRLNVPKGP